MASHARISLRELATVTTSRHPRLPELPAYSCRNWYSVQAAPDRRCRSRLARTHFASEASIHRRDVGNPRRRLQELSGRTGNQASTTAQKKAPVRAVTGRG